MKNRVKIKLLHIRKLIRRMCKHSLLLIRFDNKTNGKHWDNGRQCKNSSV